MNYDEVLKQLEDIELPERNTTLYMKLKTCEVGMFKLPGIIVERPEDWSDEHWQQTQEEMDSWVASEQGTGTRMTEYLWSFRKESQRDWFILKWSGNESCN
jgi:hypothetical protein